MQSKNWKSEIENLGFTVLDSQHCCENLTPQNTIFITGCSKNKNNVKTSKARFLYRSVRVNSFLKQTQMLKAYFLSEKYGIISVDEKIDNYDLGPSVVSENPDYKNSLLQLIKKTIFR